MLATVDLLADHERDFTLDQAVARPLMPGGRPVKD
jgi:hypothetical protein